MLAAQDAAMTSFGWKRKSHLKVNSATAFDGEEEEDREELEKEGIDWLTAAKKRRMMLLEDNKAKSKRQCKECFCFKTSSYTYTCLFLLQRLQEEGAVLAEQERYWEAIKYWDEALQLEESAVLHEMKAQVCNSQ